MIDSSQIDAVIKVELQPLWPDYYPSAGVMDRLGEWFSKYDGVDLARIVRLQSDEEVGQAKPSRAFWINVRREMDRRFGWRNRGQVNENGHTDADIDNIVRSIREPRESPLEQPNGLLLDMGRDELYDLWVAQCRRQLDVDLARGELLTKTKGKYAAC